MELSQCYSNNYKPTNQCFKMHDVNSIIDENSKLDFLISVILFFYDAPTPDFTKLARSFKTVSSEKTVEIHKFSINLRQH
jgi:hypothetical protein